jgi:TolA-binding protein
VRVGGPAASAAGLALVAALAGCATTTGTTIGGDADRFQKDFNQALALLDAGQLTQAGEAFEACAATHATHPSVPLAIFNAAIAWERANQLDRAAAQRLRLMEKFPASREAEAAQPMLAALRARQGKRDEAIALYRDFVEKFPDSPGRCSATYNLGAALDGARRPIEAAGAYLAFGSEPRCAGGDPTAAASILYRAGELFEKGGLMAEARRAYQAGAEVAGVTEVGARRLQDEARKRARR